MRTSKVLLVIIWILKDVASNTWEIKIPQKIDAISGFCVQIPCHFEIPNSFKPSLNKSVAAIWKKGSMEGAIVFSSTDNKTVLQKGQMIGHIFEQNCTTVFHNLPSETYFFRLQGDDELKYNFQPGVKITVHEDVPPPILSPVVQVMEVLEGTKVTLTCSSVISCPSTQPLMQWSQQLGQQLPPALREDEFGLIWLVSNQTFNATSSIDRLKVSCSLLYSKNGKRPAETSINLKVLYAPKNTMAVASPLGPVSEGSVVTLSCHSDANPAVQRYEWYKDSGCGKLVLQNQGQTLTMTVGSNAQGLYVCKVYNDYGSDQSRAVAIDIKSCQCSMALYILCGLLTLFLILITAVDLVKYRSLLKRLQGVESMRGHMTYATLHRTSESTYDVLQAGASRAQDDYENRIVTKH